MPDLIEQLIGGWTLVAARHEFDTGESTDIYGPDPTGAIVFTSDRRMMAILTSSTRVPDDSSQSLFQTMMFYTGRFRLEGTTMITKVDAAWIPNWVDSEQTRYINLAGENLSIRTSKHNDHPRYPGRDVVGHLTWRRDIASE